jgi:hypothetical protein
MRKDTHSALLQIKDDKGNVSTAFVSGIPDKCEHDDNGETMQFNDAGEYFKESEIPDHKTNYDEWLAFTTKHRLTGGCVSCSKCGKPFELDLFAMP